MSKKNKTFPKGRVLPPNYKFMTEVGFFKKWTLRERLKILIGYNSKVTVKIATEHNAGKFEPIANIDVTKEIEP